MLRYKKEVRINGGLVRACVFRYFSEDDGDLVASSSFNWPFDDMETRLKKANNWADKLIRECETYES